LSEPHRDTTGDDDDALRSWAGGDERAFDALVRAHGAAVYAFLCKVTRDPELASEAYSDAFLKVFRTGGAEGRGHFRPWLFTVARRCAQDVLRTERRRTRTAAAWGDEPRPAGDEPVNAEDNDALWAAVQQLPEPHRSVVILRYRHDFDSPEIARILELSEKQVRDKLVYARRVLRKVLEAEGAVS